MNKIPLEFVSISLNIVFFAQLLTLKMLISGTVSLDLVDSLEETGLILVQFEIKQCLRSCILPERYAEREGLEEL